MMEASKGQTQTRFHASIKRFLIKHFLTSGANVSDDYLWPFVPPHRNATYYDTFSLII